MANITYRSSTTPPVPSTTTAKGSALLNSEIDGNFKSLNDEKLELTDSRVVSTNTVNTVVRRDTNGDFAARIVTVTDLNSTSDQSLKTDVKPIDGLAKLEQVNPVEFTWKQSGTKSYGVIAQELEKVLPELVAQQEDGIKNVSYIPLIALLIDAVKKLDERVKELEK